MVYKILYMYTGSAKWASMVSQCSSSKHMHVVLADSELGVSVNMVSV